MSDQNKNMLKQAGKAAVVGALVVILEETLDLRVGPPGRVTSGVTRRWEWSA